MSYLGLTACEKYTPQAAAEFTPYIMYENCPGRDVGDFTSRCGKAFIDKSAPDVYVSFAVITPENTRPIPVLYLSGGPGEGGNTEHAKLDIWRYRAHDWQLDRPLILWNSRGNAGSWGYFTCEPFRQHQLAQLASPELIEQGLLDSEDAVAKRCLARWQAQMDGASLSQFSSQQHAKDAVVLLNTLGFTQWHLLGTSYGARVATWIAAEQPEATQSLLLDSPYVWSVRSRVDHVLQWASTLIPHLQQQGALLERVLNALQTTPLDVQFEVGRLPYTVTVDHIQWLHLYFAGLYSPASLPHWQAAMQAYIERADTAPMAALAADYLAASLAPGANPWAYWITECNDNTQLAPAAYRQQLDQMLKKKALYKKHDFAEYWRYGLESSICSFSSTLGPANPPPTSARIPELRLQGTYDPVVALPKPVVLPENTAVIVAEVGHGVIASEVCGEPLYTAYWREPAAFVKALNGPAANRASLKSVLGHACVTWGDATM